MSTTTKSAIAAAAFSPSEPSPPGVSVRLDDVAIGRVLRIGGPDRVLVVAVQEAATDSPDADVDPRIELLRLPS